MNLFDLMRDFARKPRAVRMASTEDVIREIHHWSPDQMLMDPDKRGDPVRT